MVLLGMGMGRFMETFSFLSFLSDCLSNLEGVSVRPGIRSALRLSLFLLIFFFSWDDDDDDERMYGKGGV